MNILITAGSTSVPIDRVRVISNVFRGRTGAMIAAEAFTQGHTVKLLTSGALDHDAPEGLPHRRYHTFDELRALMAEEIQTGAYDTIIHSAAVSDYRVDKVYAAGARTIEQRTDGKIGSSHDRLILELVPTEKLVDLIRNPWGFTGTLVKFKLQVGLTDDELLAIARKSMADSHADFIVANCLEWARERAYILDAAGGCTNVPRNDLARDLIRRIS